MGDAIRKSARGRPCTVRLPGCARDPEKTVGAHLRTTGVGLGRKPLDSMLVYACNHCHDVIDKRKRTNIMPIEVAEATIRALAETHEYLIEDGLMILK